MSPIKEEEKHGLMPCPCCDYFFNFFFLKVFELRPFLDSWRASCDFFFSSFFFFLANNCKVWPLSLSLLSNNVRDVKGGTAWNGVTCAWYPLPTESVPMTKKMPFRWNSFGGSDACGILTPCIKRILRGRKLLPTYSLIRENGEFRCYLFSESVTK